MRQFWSTISSLQENKVPTYLPGPLLFLLKKINTQTSSPVELIKTWSRRNCYERFFIIKLLGLAPYITQKKPARITTELPSQEMKEPFRIELNRGLKMKLLLLCIKQALRWKTHLFQYFFDCTDFGEQMRSKSSWDPFLYITIYPSLKFFVPPLRYPPTPHFEICVFFCFFSIKMIFLV